MDASGKCPDDVTEQFRLAFENIEAVLEEAGGALTDIVEMTSYHIGMREHLREFIAVKDELISEPYPAWTAIGCTELAMPGAVVEIRAQAVLS
jgi:enamine deaminase RidA (YjgF/YER057c/UK114 family)